jgi:hypothetical protein
MFQKISIFLQAAVLVGISTAFFFSEKKQISDSENRTLAQWPVLNDSTYLKGAYFKGISEYVNDQFPARDWLLQLSNTLRYNMGIHFEDEIRLVVVEGGMEQKTENTDSLEVASDDFKELYKNGLIIINGAAYTANTGSTAVSPVFAKLLNDYATALGPNVTVYSCIAPLSSAYIPAKQYAHLNGKNEQSLYAIRNNLQPCVRFADVLGEMNAHRDEKLFFGTDHHWTANGAYHAYVAFCKSAGLQPVDRSQMNYEKRGSFLGSLYDLTRDESIKEHPDTLELFKPRVTTESIAYSASGLKNGKKCTLFNNAYGYACFISGDQPLEKITTSVKNGRKACVVKNSMGNAFAVYLVNHFEEIWVVDFRYSKHNLMTLIRDNGINDLIFGMGMYGAMSRGTIQMMRNLGFKKAATKPIETTPIEGQPAAPAEKPTETETP